jgi:hypothetical protein
MWNLNSPRIKLLNVIDKECFTAKEGAFLIQQMRERGSGHASDNFYKVSLIGANLKFLSFGEFTIRPIMDWCSDASTAYVFILRVFPKSL